MAFVSSNATLGGAEAYLTSIIERLGPAWLAGIVVLQDGPFVTRLRELGYCVDVVPAPRAPLGMAAAAWRLRRWLAASPARVVHANGLKAALVASVATWGSRRPVLWMRHDLAGDRLLSWIVAVRCREVVAVSEAVRSAFPQSARRRVRVVYDGVADTGFDRRACRALVEELVGGGEIVTLTGRLCPGKGQRELIEVARTVLTRRPSVRFLLIGDEDPAYPGHRAKLEGRVRELELGGAVTFAGHRADAVALVAGSDLLVAPSRCDPVYGWSEGFGLAPVEAMVVGTPVVAYANGSLPEVLGDAGRVVLEGDRAALAAAITDLLGDPLARAELARRGRRRAQTRFRLDDAVARLSERYVAVAGGAHRESAPSRG